MDEFSRYLPSRLLPKARKGRLVFSHDLSIKEEQETLASLIKIARDRLVKLPRGSERDLILESLPHFIARHNDLVALLIQLRKIDPQK